MKKLNSSGFSLLELLVVIAIIGVLLSVLYASFDQARNTSVNESIRAEMKELQLAIEVYRAQNSRYPAPHDLFVADCKSSAGNLEWSWQSRCGFIWPFITNFVPEYSTSLLDRRDSRNASCDYKYYADTEGSSYKLIADRCLGGFSAAADGIKVNDEMARCPENRTCGACGVANYVQADVEFYESLAIYSQGAECW